MQDMWRDAKAGRRDWCLEGVKRSGGESSSCDEEEEDILMGVFRVLN